MDLATDRVRERGAFPHDEKRFLTTLTSIDWLWASELRSENPTLSRLLEHRVKRSCLVGGSVSDLRASSASFESITEHERTVNGSSIKEASALTAESVPREDLPG